MVGHDSDVMDDDAMFMGCLADCCFNQIFILKLLHHLISIFWAPFKVPEVQANFVAEMVKFCAYHFSRLRRGELTLFFDENECATSPADYSAAKPHKIFFRISLKAGGLNPSWH